MRINRQPAARAVQPSAQTSSEAVESTMNIEKTKLQLQNHHVVHRDTHDAGWRLGKAKVVVEDTGGYCEGSSDPWSTTCYLLPQMPPSLCLAWIPKKGSETPIGGL